MTKEQWENRHYRLFKGRTAFYTRIIEQHLIDMNEVESIGPIYISSDKNKLYNITMLCTITMKSGNKIKLDKVLKRLYRKVTYVNVFGQKRIKRIPMSTQSHFDYYAKSDDSDGGKFQSKLVNLRKDFRDNVSIIRRKNDF